MASRKADEWFVGNIEGAVQVLARRGWARERIIEVVDRALAEQREVAGDARGG